MTETLRQALRTETRPLHQKLDASVGQMHPFETPVGYVGYLLAMGRLHALFESSLDWTSEQTQIPPRATEMVRLADDDAEHVMAAHGLQTLRAGLAEALGAIEAPIQDPPESRWGTAYVMEGSALGAKHLVTRLREEKQLPCSFLESLAAGSQTRWPAFTAGLEGFSGDAELTVEAAKNAFETAFVVFHTATIQVENAISRFEGVDDGQS